MNIWQIQEWAKQQDKEEPEFTVKMLGKEGVGKFIDKGLGFVEIPEFGEGTFSLIHEAKNWYAPMYEFEPKEA
jgi:hypothetical protein